MNIPPDIRATELLAAVKSVVMDIDPEASVHLFGSRAWGDFGDESGWDFFVATSHADGRRVEDLLVDPVYELMLTHDVLIQLVVYPKVVWDRGQSPIPLFDRVREEGIAL
ncbi:nucleotidyltransferase family protein [Neolewinella litorea]|uniref:Nucleotidyltransferase domain-containing protein n=1 Tax=Neolewinella litorea TaxID=2562452 RepID=A0A4S4NE79_9BACT|nr:hypothetical protein [Neolewinella litorea]THH36398.1 hypothetical protein E4021_15035 [Neolewinella litorea]